MYTIFAAVVPVFIIILIGIVVERLQFLPENTGQVLSIFSINISIPCLLFHIMCNAPIEKLSEWRWWLGILGVQMLFLAFFYIFERRRGEKMGPAMTYSLAITFCNAGFVGVPIIMSVYDNDPAAMSAAGLMLVASNGVVIIAQMVLMAWARSLRHDSQAPQQLSLGRRVLRFFRLYIFSNAIFISTLLGVLVLVTGFRVWEPLDKAVALVGYASPPCMLFTLGLTLRGNVTKALCSHTIDVKHQLWLFSWRLVGMPLITMGVLMLLNVDPLWIAVSTIISATGTAIFVAALAQLYQAASGPASLTVAVTNMLALFSLMGTLTLLTWMGYMPSNFAL